MSRKTNLIYELKKSVEKYQDSVAFFEKKGNGYKTTSFKEFWDEVISLASYLDEKGIKKGDRVVLFIPNAIILHKYIFALYYIGAVAVFMDAWTTKKRLSLACQITKPKAFIGIFKAHLLRLLSKDIRQIPIKLSIQKNFKPVNKKFSIVEVEPDHEAIISFTTGSTGIPKAARRTHEYIWEVTKGFKSHHELEQGEVDMSSLPLFIGNNLLQGVITVLPEFNPAKPSQINAAKIARQFKDFKVTTSLGSPAFYEKLSDYLIKNNIILDIKTIFLGGAPVFPSLAKKLIKAFPKTKVEIVYGSTEAEPISHIPAEKLAEWNILNGLLVGKKVDFIELKIIKPITGPIELKNGESINSLELPLGETGEIIVTGPHVLKEYVDSPQAFKENKIVDGKIIWHRTGDAGSLDKDNNILLFGRVNNRFQIGEKQFFTLPLEQKLMELESVTFSVVVKINDKVYALLESSCSREKKEELLLKAKKILDNIEIDEFIIGQIPRDPRHNSKPNYEKIKDSILQRG